MTNMHPCVIALESVKAPAQLLLVQGSDLLLRGSQLLWPLEVTHRLARRPRQALLIDQVGSVSRYALALEEKELFTDMNAQRHSPRQFLQSSSAADFALASKALQLLHWVDSHRYCGRCGGPMHPHANERAMQCAQCAARVYPRISPCVIVLVTRGDEMLLARHTGRASSFFSCLAGFMEAGETPEETIHREVLEETSIRVSNIRYMRSQSWPFPSQLMLGFFADYAGGEIKVDGKEIAEARWFSATLLPQFPSAGFSVAGHLIELFLKSGRA